MFSRVVGACGWREESEVAEWIYFRRFFFTLDWELLGPHGRELFDRLRSPMQLGGLCVRYP